MSIGLQVLATVGSLEVAATAGPDNELRHTHLPQNKNKISSHSPTLLIYVKCVKFIFYDLDAQEDTQQAFLFTCHLRRIPDRQSRSRLVYLGK